MLTAEAAVASGTTRRRPQLDHSLPISSGSMTCMEMFGSGSKTVIRMAITERRPTDQVGQRGIAIIALSAAARGTILHRTSVRPSALSTLSLREAVILGFV